MLIPARLQPYLFAAAATLALAGFAAYDLYRERDQAIALARANTANLARLLEEHTRQTLRRVEALLNDAESHITDPPLAHGARAPLANSVQRFREQGISLPTRSPQRLS